MSYEFFLSYTRANNDDYLRQFFKDLSEELCDRLGRPKGTEVGFFDQNGGIELGDDWDPTIVAALMSSKVLVTIYSPAYFNSLYCGKEWNLFHRRRLRYLEARQAAGDAEARLPPVIKPVLWLPPVDPGNDLPAAPPLPDTVDAAVTAVQYTLGDPHDIHNWKGLKHVLKRLQDYKRKYDDYIEALAREIMQAGRAHPLPGLQGVPTLASSTAAFPVSSPAPPAGVVPPKPTAGPKHVRFVFVAAEPSNLGTARSVDSYLDAGGEDWKPFLPDEPTAIGAFAQHVASDRELGFTSDVLSFNNNLRQEVERAWAEKKIVVLIVDGWTVSWDAQCKAILEEFERGNYRNCSVLVPWNEKDPELAAQRAQIEQALRETFYFRSFARGSVFYRDSIRSADELRAALRDVLIWIKAEIRNRAGAARPLPPPITAPAVSVSRSGV